MTWGDTFRPDDMGEVPWSPTGPALPGLVLFERAGRPRDRGGWLAGWSSPPGAGRAVGRAVGPRVLGARFRSGRLQTK